jgi:Protein of unknown function (DUF2634)
MIPVVNEDLVSDFEIEQEPSKTYKLHLEKGRISGYIDNLEAVKQAVYVNLNIERYEYLIYSWNIGVEFNDLYGQPLTFVLPEIKRRITEALTQDDRIQAVDAFSFETKKGKVHATFTVHSIFGNFESDRVVNI